MVILVRNKEKAKGQRSPQQLRSLLWMALSTCESEQQHVFILVRNKVLSQLDKNNMW